MRIKCIDFGDNNSFLFLPWTPRFFYIGFADGVYPEILFIILEEI